MEEEAPCSKNGELDDREQAKLEVKVWDPDSPLTDRQIDQFLVVARAVGTFARALDCSSSVRQPSLHMSAAAASRDITLFHAMDTLHKHNYDLSSAVGVLVPLGGPVLCRDEMEEWSASEASLFEEALEKYGKDFNDIRQDFLPWKSLTSIIEYYYMWKTTDRYVQQKRLKAAEAESKLKQVYIPTYNKPNPNQISSNNGKPAAVNGAMGASYQAQATVIGRACESCYTPQSHQWYSWGPPNMQCRLCASCWIYWKKYGGLKMPTQTDEDKLSSSQPTEEPPVRTHLSRQATQGTPVRNTGSPKSAVKTRQAFFLHTTCWTKLARQVCKNTLRLRQAARRPFVPINCAAIKAEYADRHCELAGNPLKIKSTRKPLSCIIGYLEIHPAVKPSVIRSTPSLQSPSAKRLLAPSNHSSLSILGKRNYSHHNGLDGQEKKAEMQHVLFWLFALHLRKPLCLQSRKQKVCRRGAGKAFSVHCAVPEVTFMPGVSSHFVTPQCKLRAGMKMYKTKKKPKRKTPNNSNKKKKDGNFWLLHHRQTTFMATQALRGTKVTTREKILQLEENMISALVGRAINAGFSLSSAWMV
ncbi:hypothetical protein EK904_013190 [Melospiza melodia maxima]|nr:hypothetical protein EK904_013190 [Melospiza melodia maxima]